MQKRPPPHVPADNARAAFCAAAARLDVAEASADPFAMSQAHSQLGRCHAALSALPCAEGSLQQALRWGRFTGSTDLVVDLLCELSETAVTIAELAEQDCMGHGHAARERARDHAFEATTLASRVADSAWEVQVLLRASEVLTRCGDNDDAAQLQTRALRLMAGDLNRSTEAARLPALGRLADV